ncbi:hypothetical protein EZS27_029215 [termite gut metagenome]|uniref:Uncharacterized protein n=1 Tax=termite gut metagenome TaxID=433724 RepID=A0A5J4QJR1_9ZZZZ
MSSESEKINELIRWDTSRSPDWMKRINMAEYEKLAGIGSCTNSHVLPCTGSRI